MQPDKMQWKDHIDIWTITAYLQSNLEEASEKPKLRNVQNYWLVIFKKIRVVKAKEKSYEKWNIKLLDPK